MQGELGMLKRLFLKESFVEISQWAKQLWGFGESDRNSRLYLVNMRAAVRVSW